jgi:hypothetical protein
MEHVAESVIDDSEGRNLAKSDRLCGTPAAGSLDLIPYIEVGR